MNANKGNSKMLNSLIAPLNMANASKASNAANASNASKVGSGMSDGWFWLLVFVSITATVVAVCYYFRVQISDSWNTTMESIKRFNDPPPPPAPPAEVEPPSTAATGSTSAVLSGPEGTPGIVEKILPGGGGSDVFNISSNKYTYYDAEPLCNALGAELATYDQVKAAWAKGADWCNYGWVKGQMAVYPTSDATYKKLQGGAEDQRMSCGKPGINGGFFDNPEMRFGVTCVGTKPQQSKHDEEVASKGAPVSPDAMAFDKKVSQFKSEADHIGILPFNKTTWTG